MDQILQVAHGHDFLEPFERNLFARSAFNFRSDFCKCERIGTEVKHQVSFGRNPIIRDALVNGVWPQFLHPYPLSEKHFLVSCKPSPSDLWGIYLVDIFDNVVVLKQDPAGGVLLRDLVEKVHAGHASDYDLEEMRSIGSLG